VPYPLGHKAPVSSYVFVFGVETKEMSDIHLYCNVRFEVCAVQTGEKESAILSYTDTVPLVSLCSTCQREKV
jgi:hypothetical protein